MFFKERFVVKKKFADYLFNGYVREPVPIFIIAICVGISFITLATWSTIDLFQSDNLTTMCTSAKLIAYNEDGPIYTLIFSDKYYYDVPKSTVTSCLLFDRFIENDAELIIEYTSIDQNLKGRDVISLATQDGVPIISSDATENARQEDSKLAATMMWIACIIYLLVCLTSYWIISNAPKYPRIAAMLVRESFRNF